MQSKLTRRAFLGLMASLLQAAHAGPEGDLADSIAGVVLSELSFLKLDPSGVQAFARDCARNDSAYSRLKWTAFFARLDIFGLTGKQRRLANLKNDIVESYLMSSDFFIYQADETRVVRYVRYYDPQKQGCSNPFARVS